MVIFIALVTIFHVYLCAINAETDETEKGDSWTITTPEYPERKIRANTGPTDQSERKYLRNQNAQNPKYATGAKADIMRFLKNSKPNIADIKSSEETSSESEEFKIEDFLKNLDSESKKEKTPGSNVSYTRERNKYNMYKTQKMENKKHKDINKDTKVSEKENKQYVKDIMRTRSVEKGNLNQNKNGYHNKKKYHHKESGEKFRIKERMKNRHGDKERNVNPKRNPAKMQEALKLGENNVTTTPTRDKNIKVNIKAPIKENNKNKSEIHDHNSKTGGPMKVQKLSDFNTESVAGRVLNTEKKWPTLTPSNLRTHNKKEPSVLRSTRMPPMSLNQLDDQATTPKKWEKKNSGTPPNTLSPYAIMAQMKIVMDCFPHANATFETIGRTVEYNDIIIVKITDKKQRYFRADESKYMDEVPEKKIIFIVHGLSVMGMTAMEHLSTVDELKILMSYYLNHLEKFDIFLIPLANPDGYSLSHNANGMMWNKNASPQDACRGVFLDRNFDVAWNSTRQISSCSQLYPGPVPFSEVETNAVRNIFHYFGHKILAYINVHSGTYDSKVFKGDAVLYPRGYTELQTDDDKYIDLKGEVDEAMKNASFQVMSVTVDTLYNWYGKISGSSVDYASTVYGIPYALEFVMQLYQEEDLTYPIQHYALTEIWNRLIDTVFTNMWKSLHVNEIQKK